MLLKSRLDDTEIEIPVPEKCNLGIMLSGGIDSAILFYLLLKENPNIKIQPFTIDKIDGARLYIDPIIDYLNKSFNINIPKTIFVGNPNAYHKKQSRTAVLEIFEKHKNIDFVYFATNQNPNESFDYSTYPADGYPDRVKNSDHEKVLMPFINLYKTHIIDLVFEYNQERLLEITHTCTERKIGRCGQCFQCNERIWAFNLLDRKDPGTV